MTNPLKIALVAALAVASSGFPAHAADAAVLGVFRDGDFLPHVQSVKQVKAELGNAGQLREVRGEDDGYYVYRVGQHAWLVLYASEAADEASAAIEQVLYTGQPPAPWAGDQPVGKPLLGDTLDGVALGSDIRELKARKSGLEPGTSTLFGAAVDVYEYAPFKGQEDLRYRFFARDGKIIAFSILVTE